MQEEKFFEKIISYDNFEDVEKIINNNLKENYFLVRHSTIEKKLFFKNFENPNTKIFGEI